MADKVLNWGELGAYGTTLADTAADAVTATVDTDGVAVDITFTGQTPTAAAATSDTTGYVSAGEPFDPNSHLKLSAANSPAGLSDTSTTVLDFRSTDTSLYSDNVQNVCFRLSDVDTGTGSAGDEFQTGVSFQDVVSIRAYDADGNEVPVELTAGSSVTTSGDTVSGGSTTDFDDAESSVLVVVPGPVSKIEIDYNNGGDANQAMLVSNVQFSTMAWHEDDENCPPVAVDDSARTELETTINVDVLANDYDPDGDDIFLVDAMADNGTVVVNGDGTIDYTPNDGYIGKDNITYTIRDEHGATATGEVEVTVETVGNSAPDANDDSASTAPSTSVVIPVLANDTDADNDTLTIVEAPDSAHGWTEFGNNGELIYTPDDGFTGTDTFTYEVTDGNGGYDTATVTVTVGNGGGVNIAPVAGDDNASTTINDGIVLSNLLANDTDANGDTLTIKSVDAPANGTAVLNGDGTVTYTPATDYVGTDTFTYTVQDGKGGEDTATVTVNVSNNTGGNNAPDAVNDTISTGTGEAVTIPVLGNDSDPDNDALSITEVSDASHGNAVISGNTVVYTPVAGYEGPDSFTYTITDGKGGFDTATVTVNVGDNTGGNVAPVAGNDTGSTLEDTALTLTNLLANDTDANGDTLTIKSVDAPLNGTAVLNGDGTVTYTPNLGYLGNDVFTYTVQDGNGGEDTATVTINVGNAGGNNAPVAGDDTVSGNEDADDITFNPLANDTDPDGDTLRVQSVTQPANGTAQVNADGTVSYTPNPNFFGTDTFTYKVTDGKGGEDTGTVTVNVAGVNDDPEADNDADTTPINTAITVNVLANDDDVDGDTLTVASVGTANNGTVVNNNDGTVTYTPNNNYTGTDTFTYTVSDGNGGTDTATVTINVGTPARDGIIEGTNGDDVIDENYLGDPDTPPDRVDNNDAILPGTTGDDDSIRGGDGDDTITAGEGSDTVDGGDDNDVIDTGGSNPRIDTDVFPVPAGQQNLDPLNGNDEDPDPSDDLDSVDGGAGNDIIRTGDDDDTINGGTGNDTIEAGIDDDLVDGGDGDDSITDVQGSDTINGGQGNDTIIAGIDTFSDYAGDDPNLPILGFTSDPNKDDGRDLVDGGAGNDSIQTGDDADTILGGTGNDTIDAGIDDDLVDGGEGGDSILGGHGADTLDGGDGNDYIDGSAPAALAILDATDPLTNNDRDSIIGGAGDDTLIGGDDDDTLIGGTGDDSLNGGIDEDVLDGGDGDDTLIGGDGADTISGGDGRDAIVGATAGDVVDGGDGPAGLGADGRPLDYDTLDLRGSAPTGGSLRVVYTSQDREDGYVEFFDDTRTDGSAPISTMTFEEIENVIPCFTPGTMIATPMGERKVEDLQPGDRVITRDNGIQTLAWVGRKDLGADDLARNPHLRPILIRKGALGNGLPETDLLVSPNHRVLVSNDKTALYFEEREVLVAAKHLTGLDGVSEVDADGVGYIHVMFDRHEVILSNGAWTESFQPGDYSLKGIGNAQRNEILELFPELATEEGLETYQSARRSLKRHEALLLVG
ncbi:Ig-like domain-containing protein [Pseudoprimorskyibacter insulae]|uniref:Bifunctional hemolysin/adenylate cyclase n=1 Tax=Pseudoprimorskyibacter insulae TaxID=1695997 RepID=A0A2R8AWH4_9RHOB|nr:Ig-like domain-containing protein [Pseudoprimorskyibacter insulae]SPF80392.1 Bifunctional hemolysin/adenylate cyclase [Pseudoprimorskyibacter insulae]